MRISDSVAEREGECVCVIERDRVCVCMLLVCATKREPRENREKGERKRGERPYVCEPGLPTCAGAESVGKVSQLIAPQIQLLQQGCVEQLRQLLNLVPFLQGSVSEVSESVSQ
jgi:hypothetical protein